MTRREETVKHKTYTSSKEESGSSDSEKKKYRKTAMQRGLARVDSGLQTVTHEQKTRTSTVKIMEETVGKNGEHIDRIKSDVKE